MRIKIMLLVAICVFCGAQPWESIGPDGRFALVVAPDPIHQDSIYGIFGAMSDIRLELFRTPDAGDSWDTIGHYTGLTLHPATAETIFAAFGTGSFSDGIWRSNDYGLTFDFPPPIWFYMARGMVYDPVDNSRAYGWGDGLMRSTDGGATWVEIHILCSDSNFDGVAVDPVRNNRVYAWNFGGEFFRSNDYGVTWTLTHTFAESMSPDDVVIAYEDSTKIFAACWGGLAKSTDCGDTWENIALVEPPSNCIWVSEVSSEYVIIGGRYGVRISSDGGTTWALLGDSVTCEVEDFAVGPRGLIGEYWYIGTARFGIQRMPAIIFSEGPIISSYFPLDSVWVSLDSFDVFIDVHDLDGIDSTSVIFDVDGTIWTCAAPELWLADSGLIFRDEFLSGDTVHFELTSVSDILGNPSDMLPFEWTIFIDTEAPELTYRYPDSAEVVTGTDITAKIYAREDGSGIDSASFYVVFDSETLDISSLAVIIDADTILVHLPSTGIVIAPGDTIDVAVHFQDRATIGGANMLDASWSFSIEPTGIADAQMPISKSLSVYPNPFNASCLIESGVGVTIYNIYGDPVKSIDSFESGRALWNGRSECGEALPSGVYYLRQNAGDRLAKRLILLK